MITPGRSWLTIGSACIVAVSSTPHSSSSSLDHVSGVPGLGETNAGTRASVSTHAHPYAQASSTGQMLHMYTDTKATPCKNAIAHRRKHACTYASAHTHLCLCTEQRFSKCIKCDTLIQRNTLQIATRYSISAMETKRGSPGASYGPESDPSFSANPSSLPRISSFFRATSSRTPPASDVKIVDSEVSCWPKPAGGGGGDQIGGELCRISSFPRCLFSFIPGSGSP